MFLIGLGTAVAPHRYLQRECWDAICGTSHLAHLSVRSRTLLRKILLSDNGIESRYLALDSLDEVFATTPEVLTKRFAQHAPTLASQAAERALEQARLQPAKIDGVLVSTCTGYLCPGLSSYVIEHLGLRPDTRALDLVGQGCGAALPNLQTAAALLASGQCQRVLSICVEVCSAAFYLDDDPGVLISACLFGDGAAAAVLATESLAHTRRVEWVASAQTLSPSDRESLRFEFRDGMLRNILSKEVPLLASRFTAQVLDENMKRAQISRDQLTAWILHPGGRNVLLALRDHLQLSDDDLRWSAAVLREYGNLSSASVLFVLQTALNGGATGGYWWMSSFGAGFSSYGAILKVD